MGAAVSDPVYNDDFTQMSVELRDNIYWSDGVQFTADDLIFTVETVKATPGLNARGWHANLNKSLASVEKTGDFSVTFHLTEPTPRFHALLEARWGALYMMPKHVFENIDDLPSYTYLDGPYLGAYLPVEEDPSGVWQLFVRRDDWERSPAGIITGNPGPKYILEINYGGPDRKVMPCPAANWMSITIRISSHSRARSKRRRPLVHGMRASPGAIWVKSARGS